MTTPTALPVSGALKKLGIAAGIAFLAAQFMPAPSSAATGPFGFLAGSWSGNGTIKVKSGQKERIRCKVGYTVTSDGSSFEQVLKCASDSYTFDARSNVAHDDGSLSGTWNIYNLKGQVSGVYAGNKIQARVRGDGLMVSVAVTTNGNDQSVFITSEGTDVTEVSIKLRKSQ